MDLFTRKDSESEWLFKDNLETNPITIKPKTSSHVAEQFSWVPLSYCSPPRCPIPIESLALSAHVSPRTIHFWVLDKSPVSGPGRDPPSCNTSNEYSGLIFFMMDWLISLQSKGLLKESSPTPQFKSINSLVLSFLYSLTFTSLHDYWKNYSFD